MEDKTCLECGEKIEQGSMNKKEYESRKFCNSACAAKYNNKKRAKIYYCKYCHGRLERKKVFCDNKCQADYEYEEYIRRWKKGEEDGLRGRYSISKYIQRYMFEKNGNVCERCGWGETNQHSKNIPLEVEHIDGDYTNNKEENLALLCPNCHALTSTYKGANRGFGRKGRHVS